MKSFGWNCRSYYKCTTQKCTVKKRVERSFQDPSIVITTYEGQHNHPIPVTLRGNTAAMFSHSMFTPAPMETTRPVIFPQDILVQMAPHLSNQAGANSTYPQILNDQHLYDHQYHHQVPEYGLVQDIVPSMFFKQEPWNQIFLSHAFVHTHIYIYASTTWFQIILFLTFLALFS